MENCYRPSIRAPSMALILLAVLFNTIPVFAQQNKPDSKSLPSPPAVFDVKLVEDPTVSINYPDNAPAIPQACDSDGNPYIEVLSENGSQIIGFTPKGVVLFGTNRMTDIPEPRIGRFFAAGSEIYVFVIGLENAKKEDQHGQNADGQDVRYVRTRGEEHKYIARFDSDGTYRGALKLDFDFSPIQVAAFSSGNLLVAGLDANKTPRVGVLSSTGQFLTYLTLPKDLTEEKQQKDAEASLIHNGLPASVEVSAIFANFYPYKQNILFVRTGNTTPIYEISESGTVRAVRLKLPSGWTVDHSIPSFENWFVDVNDGNFSTSAKNTVFEVNPMNGEPLAEYRIGSKNLLEEALACESQGTFVGIRHKGGRVTLVRGTARPTERVTTAPAQ